MCVSLKQFVTPNQSGGVPRPSTPVAPLRIPDSVKKFLDNAIDANTVTVSDSSDENVPPAQEPQNEQPQQRRSNRLYEKQQTEPQVSYVSLAGFKEKDAEEEDDDNIEVLQELQSNMQLGLSALAAGTTVRPTRASQLLSRQDLNTVRQLASDLSTSIFIELPKEAPQTEAQQDSDVVVIQSSGDERVVFNHDESEDDAYFEAVRAADRKFIYIHTHRHKDPLIASLF